MDVQAELKRATRGDRDALRRIVDRWIPKIRRWAWVFCGEAGVAEDAVQESLIRLVRFIGKADPDRPFGPWLKTLVRNASISELARRRRTEEREVHDPLTESKTSDRPDRALDLTMAAELVNVAFRELSPRQREIFDQVDLQGRAAADVARELGLTPGAVRAQLHAARRAIRQHLTDEHVALVREA